jgi:hypothetical protein
MYNTHRRRSPLVVNGYECYDPTCNIWPNRIILLATMMNDNYIETVIETHPILRMA